MIDFAKLSKLLFAGGLDSSLAELYGADEVVTQRGRYAELLTRLSIQSPDGEPFFVSAPGRTELGGNHTDHNHGNILAAAVDLDCVAAVVPSGNTLVTLHSSELPASVTVDLQHLNPVPEEEGRPAALIRGVAASFAALGGMPRGFHAVLHATSPPGIGISTSAAFSVCIGAILSHLDPDISCTAVQLAQMAQRAENDFFGKPCGLMDQMASAVGQVISVDFMDPVRPQVQKIIPDMASSGYRLALIDTGGSHTELTPEYAAIPAEMRAAAKAAGGSFGREISREMFFRKLPDIRRAAGDRAALRLLHFIGENERVVRMADLLRAGNFPKFLTDVQASGVSSCNLLQNCSTTTTSFYQGVLLALAVVPELCPGAVCRVHGGGFAGTVQVYVPQQKFAAFVPQVETIFGTGSVHPLRIGRPGVCLLSSGEFSVPR